MNKAPSQRQHKIVLTFSVDPEMNFARAARAIAYVGRSVDDVIDFAEEIALEAGDHRPGDVTVKVEDHVVEEEPEARVARLRARNEELERRLATLRGDHK